MRGDRGDVIVGWLTKVTVVIGVLGVMSFDAVSVGVAKMNADDVAATAAAFGAETWNATHNIQHAYRAASSFAEERGATIAPADFSVDRDGTVRVRVVKEATTVLLYRTSKTKGWARVEGTGARRGV
jgi:hypothetical protein